jgi:hypothetical protein
LVDASQLPVLPVVVENNPWANLDEHRLGPATVPADWFRLFDEVEYREGDDDWARGILISKNPLTIKTSDHEIIEPRTVRSLETLTGADVPADWFEYNDEIIGMKFV